MVTVKRSNFGPRETLSIQAPDGYHAGIAYGKAVAPHIATYLRSNNVPDNPADPALSQAASLLSYAESLAQNPLFVIRNRNILKEYLDILRGYCKGAGISLNTGVLLQSEIVSGCQTLLVQNAADRSIGFLHTEENFDDRSLFTIYRYIDEHPKWNPSKPLPENIDETYTYKIVDMKIGSRSYTYFGYPGLCFGGPAVGFSHTDAVFLATDTIGTDMHFENNSLWVNAVASMLLLIGDPADIRAFIKRLSVSQIRFHNGYAFHIADCAGLSITSYEVGGTHAVTVPPDTYGDRLYIAQPNLPRSPVLLSVDELSEKRIRQEKDLWNIQAFIEMTGRVHRLKDICTNPDLRVDESFRNQISDIMYTTRGDAETDFYNPDLRSFTGLISPYLAGYATGFATRNATEIEFGRFFPVSTVHKRPKLWYASDDILQDGMMDLFAEAKKYLKSHARSEQK